MSHWLFVFGFLGNKRWKCLFKVGIWNSSLLNRCGRRKNITSTIWTFFFLAQGQLIKMILHNIVTQMTIIWTFICMLFVGVIERILALEIWQLYSVHFSLHRIADVLLFFSDHNLWCNISYLYSSFCHLKCVIQVKRYFEYSDPNGTVNEIWREIGQKLPLIKLMINREKRLVKRDSIEPDCSCLCTNQSTLFTSLWYRNRCCKGLVQMSPDVSGEGSFLRPEEWRMLMCSFIVWRRMKEPPAPWKAGF